MLNNLNIINANSAPVTPALIMVALLKSDLHWEMHMAQLYSLETQALAFTTEPIVLESEVKEVPQDVFNNIRTEVTLLGLPVRIDNEVYPKGLIRLMHGNKELYRIECLAIPTGFGNYNDWEAELKSERDKFAKLK
jgi:hypothetical protein